MAMMGRGQKQDLAQPGNPGFPEEVAAEGILAGWLGILSQKGERARESMTGDKTGEVFGVTRLMV